MKYMFTFFVDEAVFDGRTPEQQRENMKRWDDLTTAAVDAGVYVSGEGLERSATATTLRVSEGGEPLVTDGPFAETREQLGGFYVLDCENLDDALAWAKRIPMRAGSIEVRPVMDYEAAGSTAHSHEREAQR